MLFAVDETHSGSPQGQPDTVAIVGIDGVARARATLTPRGVPQIGNAAPVLYPVAVAAAGAVWWIDGGGVVRRLAVGDAAPRQVAVFAQSSAQQTLSFAVSPDGSQLEAARLTFSPFQRSTDPNNPFGTGGVPQRLDVMTSPAGGSTTLLRSTGSPGYQVLAVVGWSSAGPLAVLDGPVGAQAPVPRPWYGHAAHLDASGSPGSVLGGGSCRSVVAAADDAVVCLSDDFQTVTLRDTGGSQRFQATLAAPVQGTVALSPSADRICTGHQVVGASAAATVSLPEAFSCQGWLDASTVVGVLGASPTGEMAVVHLASPGTAVDLGFRGEFDGVVQRPA